MKIKLHFDDIIYQLQNVGGISIYWKELISRIYKCEDFQIQHTKGSKIARYLPVYTNAQVFHSSYYRKPIARKTKNVVTVHDFAYELGFLNTLNKGINIWQTKLAINAADAIVCVSENTKKNLLQIYPHLVNHPSIYVISHGTPLQFYETFNHNPSENLMKLVINNLKRYVLFVGKRNKYKNFVGLIESFAASCLPKNGFRLFCIGSKFSDSENNFIHSLGLKDNVIAIENITNSDLIYLYKNAFALAYPSLYEGLGLPPHEAMIYGCPVIASNTSSIPEVVGDAGILTEPHDIKARASALEKLLCNETRNSYIIKGFARAKLFSWDKAAQKYIEIYKSLVTKDR